MEQLVGKSLSQEERFKKLEEEQAWLRKKLENIQESQKLLEDQFKVSCNVMSVAMKGIKEFRDSLERAMKIVESKRSPQ